MNTFHCDFSFEFFHFNVSKEWGKKPQTRWRIFRKNIFILNKKLIRELISRCWFEMQFPFAFCSLLICCAFFTKAFEIWKGLCDCFSLWKNSLCNVLKGTKAQKTQLLIEKITLELVEKLFMNHSTWCYRIVFHSKLALSFIAQKKITFH